jgi:hypothetical protein
MPRSLSLLVLLAMAGCAPAPELLSPRVKPPPMPKPWPSATLRIIPGLDHSRGMPVAVPDTEKLERMPVARPDTTNDRGMVMRGRTFTIRGPASVPVSPSSDTFHVVAPRP